MDNANKTAAKLTPAQDRAIRLILSWGGVWEKDLHMGRKERGGLNKRLVHNLCDVGLLDQDEVEASWRQKYASYPGGVTTSYKYFVSAAGCIAIKQADDRAMLKAAEAA